MISFFTSIYAGVAVFAIIGYMAIQYEVPVNCVINSGEYGIMEYWFNSSIATLKPRSNGPSYSNTVTGTLAVDGWAVTFGTGACGLQPAATL